MIKSLWKLIMIPKSYIYHHSRGQRYTISAIIPWSWPIFANFAELLQKFVLMMIFLSYRGQLETFITRTIYKLETKFLVDYLPHLECAIQQKLNWIHLGPSLGIICDVLSLALANNIFGTPCKEFPWPPKLWGKKNKPP